MPTISELATLYDLGLRAGNTWYLTQTLDYYPMSGTDSRVRLMNLATGAITHGGEGSAYALRCVTGT